jgi:hypothetical protein
MSLQDAVTKVVAVLRDLEIPYVLVGAFSSNAHGIPRSTQDADFVAIVDIRQVAAIVDRLGPHFRIALAVRCCGDDNCGVRRPDGGTASAASRRLSLPSCHMTSLVTEPHHE